MHVDCVAFDSIGDKSKSLEIIQIAIEHIDFNSNG